MSDVGFDPVMRLRALGRRLIPSAVRTRGARRARELYWSLAGPLLGPPPTTAPFRSLLILCHGNICRSPFAEHLARDLAAQSGGAFVVASAGLRVLTPQRSPEAAILAARAFGVRLEGHVARPLTDALVAAHDRILVMEPGQARAVRRGFPAASGRIMLLAAYDPGRNARDAYRRYHIEDPYGGDVNCFTECYERISVSLVALLGEHGFR